VADDVMPWQNTCPFRPCRAFLFVEHRAPSSDRLNERVDVYPLHDVVGEHSWYGRCPGSSLLMPLSERGREVLADNMGYFERRLAERKLEAARLNITTEATREANEAIEAEKRAGTLGHLDRPGEDYYPPRPSDTEEAQDSGAAAALETPDVQGIPMGRNSVSDAMRDQTIALANLAATGAEQLGLIAMGIVNLAQALEQQIIEAQEKADAVYQLTLAAVGSSNPPDPAQSALAASLAAIEALQNCGARIVGVVTHSEGARAQAMVTETGMRQYAGMI
jgi:hypothetical protein